MLLVVNVSKNKSESISLHAQTCPLDAFSVAVSSRVCVLASDCSKGAIAGRCGDGAGWRRTGPVWVGVLGGELCGRPDGVDGQCMLLMPNRTASSCESCDRMRAECWGLACTYCQKWGRQCCCEWGAATLSTSLHLRCSCAADFAHCRRRGPVAGSPSQSATDYPGRRAAWWAPSVALPPTRTCAPSRLQTHTECTRVYRCCSHSIRALSWWRRGRPAEPGPHANWYSILRTDSHIHLKYSLSHQFGGPLMRTHLAAKPPNGCKWSKSWMKMKWVVKQFPVTWRKCSIVSTSQLTPYEFLAQKVQARRQNVTELGIRATR